MGKSRMPFKRNDIEKRVEKIDGVRQVINRIDVLPVSRFDEELRYRIARSIYGNSNFWNYAIMAEPADSHHRRPWSCHVNRRRAEQCRPDAGKIAGRPVRRDVGEKRIEDRGRGQDAA